MKSLLSIAGLDPTCGAGLFQDAITFQYHGFHPLVLPTQLVAEDSQRVSTTLPISAGWLEESMSLLQGDFDIRGVKLGLITPDVGFINTLIPALQQLKQQRSTPIVWDPVWSSSGGFDFFAGAKLTELLGRLGKVVDVLTPNVAELARVLATEASHQPRHLETMAGEFYRRFALPVVVTGIRLAGEGVADLCYAGKQFDWVEGVHHHQDPHGTGCLHASLLLVALAQGMPLEVAAQWAKLEVAKSFSRLRFPAKSLRPFVQVS